MRGGRRLINFETYRALSEKISEVLRYQGKHRDLDSSLINFQPLTYLEEQISGMTLDASADAVLEARGENLRALENA